MLVPHVFNQSIWEAKAGGALSETLPQINQWNYYIWLYRGYGRGGVLFICCFVFLTVAQTSFGLTLESMLSLNFWSSCLSLSVLEFQACATTSQLLFDPHSHPWSRKTGCFSINLEKQTPKQKSFTGKLAWSRLVQAFFKWWLFKYNMRDHFSK